MISVLFIAMVILVGSAAVGREIEDELGRIRRGEKPAADEVRHQWDQVTAEARSRWDTLREQSQERRQKRQERRRKRHEAH
jgi:membrane protein